LAGDRRCQVNSGRIGLRQEGVLQQRAESRNSVGWRAVLMDHQAQLAAHGNGCKLNVDQIGSGEGAGQQAPAQSDATIMRMVSM